MNAPRPPELSIIIVNWNVRDLLRACLLSVRREVRLPGGVEVIVIDNDSADASVAMLKEEFPDVALIESPVNLGFGAGCNRAYLEARGEYVLLLNPDTELVDDAVGGMLGVMRSRPKAGIVAPRLMNTDRSFQTAAGGAFPTLANVAWHYLFFKRLLPKALGPETWFIEEDSREVRAIDWVSGAAMLLRREAIGATIFDESFFMFGEDMDVCDRMRRSGWEVLYDGEHSIVHHHGQSFKRQESLTIRASAHGGPRRVFRKQHGRVQVLIYDAILLLGFLVRWPLYAILERVRPGHGYAERSRFAYAYVSGMLHDRKGPTASSGARLAEAGSQAASTSTTRTPSAKL